MELTSPVNLRSHSLVVKESIPSLKIGRRLLVTVLKQPRNGKVLVSLFGRRMTVETTMQLNRGQVLNLKVHAVEPRVILKPEAPPEQSGKATRLIEGWVERIVGRFGEKPLHAFSLRNIVEHMLDATAREGLDPQVLRAVLDEVLTGQGLAFLIPVIDGDSGGNARVVIAEHPSAGYTIHFDMQTDHLGQVEATAVLHEGLDVEIRTARADSADFLRDNIIELFERLEPLGVRRLEVLHQPRPGGVSVLV